MFISPGRTSYCRFQGCNWPGLPSFRWQPASSTATTTTVDDAHACQCICVFAGCPCFYHLGEQAKADSQAAAGLVWPLVAWLFSVPPHSTSHWTTTMTVDDIHVVIYRTYIEQMGKRYVCVCVCVFMSRDIQHVLRTYKWVKGIINTIASDWSAQK